MRSPAIRRLALVASLLVVLSSASSASAARLFVLKGAGYGHGIGLSQYGAEGYARSGSTYDRILAHYYPGTTLASGYSATIRVLLASGRASLTVGSDAQFNVTDANDNSYSLAAGGHILKPNLVVTDASGAEHALASPATFQRGADPLELGGSPYRGTLRVYSSGSALSAVNHVDLESYLKGVVPREMPSTWRAVKAQAVAARSYALATRRTGDIFDVYPDTRSQVYGGIAAETAATNAAVDETAGQVLTYGGAVAVTYFFSTSGGKTAAIQDGWPGAAPVPYLVSVDDPYDSISPHHRWGPGDPETDCPGTTPDCIYTGTQLNGRLGLSVLDATVVRNPSNRVSSVNVTTSGGTTSISGPAFRTKLGLRSTWFSIGVLSLTPAHGRIVWGQRDSLAIFTRGIANVTLQKRPYGGVWQNIASVPPGNVTFSVSPRRATSYRLVSPLATGPAAGVQVAAKIVFAATQPSYGLVGAVRPKSLAGRAVQVQRRRADGSWATVATAVVDRDGVFRARFAVRAGVYRARIVPPSGSGLVTGVSPTLTVTTG